MDSPFIAQSPAPEQPASSWEPPPRTSPARNAFADVLALGFGPLVPIVPPGASLSPNSTLAVRANKPGKDPRGKAPGILKGDGNWSGFDWMRQPPPTSTDLAAWHSWGASVGLRMGDGLVTLDVDTTDKALAEKALRITCETIPGAHAVLIGRSPKFAILLRIAGRQHVPYRMIEFMPAGRDRREKPDRIELLSRGKQKVVVGVHPGTGKPYTWQPAMPRLQDVIEVEPATLAALFEKLADAMPGALAQRIEGSSTGVEAPQAQLRGSPNAVRRAIEALPNTTKHFPSRESHRDIGYALKAALPNDEAMALSLFEAWSDRWEDPPDGDGNADGYAAAVWQTLRPPFRLGASWLYEKLEATTGTPAASAWLEPIETPAGELFDLQPSAPALAATISLAGRQIDGNSSARDLPVRQWLVRPWCPANAVSAIVGAPGVSKSTYALRLAVAVANEAEAILCGAPRLSLERLHGRGPVLVYNREDDLDEMERRIHGLQAHHGLGAFRHPVHIFSGVEGRLVLVERLERGGAPRRAPGLDWLRGRIREHRPVLVILDPLVSLTSGLEENSNDDMEALLAELRALAAVERTTIIVVHHAGKGAEKASGELSASRGASAIMGAVRGGVTLTSQTIAETPAEGPLRGLFSGTYVVAEGIKANYGPKAEPIVYRLKSMPVGNGAGEPMSANADLLFDDGDANAHLTSIGDTVAVHELVDRRGSEALAKAAAAAKATNDAQKIALHVAELLDGRAETPLTALHEQLAARLKAGGLLRGTSRQIVSERLQDALAHGGQRVSYRGLIAEVSMSKSAEGHTSPWFLRFREAVLEGGDNALSDLFD